MSTTSNLSSDKPCPQKINYGAYGSTMPHVRFHIVPKYADAPKWGGAFDMMPENKIFLTDSEYENTIREIRKYLKDDIYPANFATASVGVSAVSKRRFNFVIARMLLTALFIPQSFSCQFRRVYDVNAEKHTDRVLFM